MSLSTRSGAAATSPIPVGFRRTAGQQPAEVGVRVHTAVTRGRNHSRPWRAGHARLLSIRAEEDDCSPEEGDAP